MSPSVDGGNGMVCSTCGRRAAFYYRHSSGERLCIACLEESLVNYVKHSFAGRIKLGKAPCISVYIPLERILEGFSLAYLLSKIEVKFNGHVIVMTSHEVMNALRKEGIDALLLSRGNVSYEIIETPKLLKCLTGESIKTSIEVIRDARSSEIIQRSQAFLLPHTLTDLNEVFMEYVILGTEDLDLLDLKGVEVDGVPVIYPFRKVQRTDVIAFSYAIGSAGLIQRVTRALTDGCIAHDLIKRLVLEVSMKHPELTYSMLKSIKFFRLPQV
ncbi:MAG: hypothetical protein QXP80_01480 [Zestosphaera sp.]